MRRLGLNGGETIATSTATSSTTATSATATSSSDEANNKTGPDVVNSLFKSANAVPLNILSSQIEENDENQHKQKQLKFDNEVGMEIGLNNNESSSLGKESTHLTNRSRLLIELERQHIENKLNQNTKESSDVAKQDVEMQSDDSVRNKSVDVDSGVENMETDEISPAMDTSLGAPKVTLDHILTEEAKAQEAEIALSRILDAFWFDHCEGQIIVSDTANFYKDIVIDEGNPVQFNDLTFQIICEIVVQYFDGKRIDFKASGSDSIAKGQMTIATSAAEPERMDIGDTSCLTTPNLKPHNLPDHGALAYLIQSYLRCCTEYERYGSARNQQKFDTVVLDVIGQVKKLLITSAKLLLNGKMVKQLRTGTHAQTHRSILLKMMYDDAVPSDFLYFLIEESHAEHSVETIFGTLIHNLYIDMQSRVVSKNIDTSPINILKQLLDITINGTNTRPICNLVIGLQNFCPTLCTATQGREIVKASYLGPFLSLSVFSEENPKLAEDVDDNWEGTFGNSLRLVCIPMKLT